MRRLKRKIIRGSALGVALAAAIGAGSVVSVAASANVSAQELDAVAPETTGAQTPDEDNQNSPSETDNVKASVSQGDASSNTNQTPDNQASKIKSLSFDKAEYSVGENIKMKLESEDTSGIFDAQIGLTSDSGRYGIDIYPIKISDTIFEGEIKSSDTWNNGNYYVNSIMTKDKESITLYSDEAYPIPTSAQASFTLNNSKENYDKLKINSVSVDKKEVSPGDTITITIEPESENHNIEYIYIVFNEKDSEFNTIGDGYDKGYIYIYPNQDGKFTKEIAIDNSYKNTIYEVKYIESYEGQRSYYYYSPQAFLNDTAFNVRNSAATENAPKIKYVYFDKEKYTPKDTVKISAELENGIADYIDIGIGGLPEAKGALDKYFGGARLYPNEKGIYEGQYQLPDRQTIGSWTDCWCLLTATVKSGNDVRTYSENAQMGVGIVDFDTNKFSIDTATIVEKSIQYHNTEGDGAVYEAGSGALLEFVFKRSENDAETYSHFTGAKVDGTLLNDDQYTAKPGNVSITLAPEYVETLDVGEHNLTALFDDGNDVTVKFSIVKDTSAEPLPDNNGTPVDDPQNTKPEPENQETQPDNENTKPENQETQADNENTESEAQIDDPVEATKGSETPATSTSTVKSDNANNTGNTATPVTTTQKAVATPTSKNAVTTATNDGKVSAAKTGDKNHTFTWIIAAGSALATATAAMLLRRRKKEEK